MKNKIFAGVLVITALCITLGACKKEVKATENHPGNEETAMSLESISSFESSMYVSSYGFLVFNADTDLDSYLNFVQTQTHAEIQRYLQVLEFNSLGATIYGEEMSDELVTATQAIDYVFNEYNIFQVENTIMKPIDETTDEVKWPFLLAMVPENLSAASYESLMAGVYDANTMNKFATNPLENTIVLFEFMDENPSGYADTEPNAAQARRPFWGKETTCEDRQCFNAQTNNYFNCSWVTTRKYIFWFLVWEGRGDDDGFKYGSCDDNGY